MGSMQSTHLKFLRNSTPFHRKCVCNVIFNSLIRACVANEILKRFGSVRVGDGGSPRNCWWGVTFGVLNRDPISDQNNSFFYMFIRSRGFLENQTDFRLLMVKMMSVF